MYRVHCLLLLLAVIAVSSSRDTAGTKRFAASPLFPCDIVAYNDADLMLGKDREIFHAALDLKWMWSKATNKDTWVGFAKGVVQSVTRFFTSDANDKLFRDIASDILSDIQIYKLNADIDGLSGCADGPTDGGTDASGASSDLRVFVGNIRQAKEHALLRGKFIVAYIEEGDTKLPTAESIEFRKALSNPKLSAMLNSQYVFVASSVSHPPMRKLMKKFGMLGRLPIFAIFSPSVDVTTLAHAEGDAPFAPNPTPTPPTPRLSLKSVDNLELLATLRLPIQDIKASKLCIFLDRVSEVFEAVKSNLQAASRTKNMTRKNVIETTSFSLQSLQHIEWDRQNKGELLRRLPKEPLEAAGNVVTVSLNVARDSDTFQSSPILFTRRFLNIDPVESVVYWASACCERYVDVESEEVSIVHPMLQFVTSDNLRRPLRNLLPAHTKNVILSIEKKAAKA